ncbi:MAG: hypothetical protein ACR2MB_15185 [Acidimicrobiales bacterium]
MAQTLTYRLYQDADLPGMLRLWEESSGWGTLTPELWRQWYVDTPHGPSLIAVALDEDEQIAGQWVFTPSAVLVEGRDVSALRFSAPILRADLRRSALRSPFHPAVQLYLTGAEAAVARGYGLVYGLPDPAWLPASRLLARFEPLRYAVAEFACVAVSIAPPSQTVAADPRNCAVDRVTTFGGEYDALWQSAQATGLVRCGVIRSSDWLQHKNGHHLSLEVRDSLDMTLLGYTAIKVKTGLLVDILACSAAALVRVLAATLDWLAGQGGEAWIGDTGHLKAMESPALRPALRALGFAPVDYKFAFVCKALAPSLSTEAVSPACWYLTPGD